MLGVTVVGWELGETGKFLARVDELNKLACLQFNVCKDHHNQKEVPDPIVKDLISDKI